MQVKDVTTTTFGLIIAYLLPGLVGLYSARYWLESFDRLFTTFTTAQSNVGLFLLVTLASLAVGLLLTPVKALLYEELVCRGQRLKLRAVAQLADPGKHDALRVVIDEQYRYHQCWGNMSIALPPLLVGWLRHEWERLSVTGRGVGTALAVGICASTTWAAVTSYRRYVDRATAVLGRKVT